MPNTGFSPNTPWHPVSPPSPRRMLLPEGTDRAPRLSVSYTQNGSAPRTTSSASLGGSSCKPNRRFMSASSLRPVTQLNYILYHLLSLSLWYRAARAAPPCAQSPRCLHRGDIPPSTVATQLHWNIAQFRPQPLHALCGLWAAGRELPPTMRSGD